MSHRLSLFPGFLLGSLSALDLVPALVVCICDSLWFPIFWLMTYFLLWWHRHLCVAGVLQIISMILRRCGVVPEVPMQNNRGNIKLFYNTNRIMFTYLPTNYPQKNSVLKVTLNLYLYQPDIWIPISNSYRPSAASFLSSQANVYLFEGYTLSCILWPITVDKKGGEGVQKLEKSFLFNIILPIELGFQHDLSIACIAITVILLRASTGGNPLLLFPLLVYFIKCILMDTHWALLGASTALFALSMPHRLIESPIDNCYIFLCMECAVNSSFYLVMGLRYKLSSMECCYGIRYY